jgi:hypothetical protein
LRLIERLISGAVEIDVVVLRADPHPAGDRDQTADNLESR